MKEVKIAILIDADEVSVKSVKFSESIVDFVRKIIGDDVRSSILPNGDTMYFKESGIPLAGSFCGKCLIVGTNKGRPASTIEEIRQSAALVSIANEEICLDVILINPSDGSVKDMCINSHQNEILKKAEALLNSQALLIITLINGDAVIITREANIGEDAGQEGFYYHPEFNRKDVTTLSEKDYIVIKGRCILLSKQRLKAAEVREHLSFLNEGIELSHSLN